VVEHKKIGREVYRVDPIADVETARRPAGYAAIPSRTQHPATSSAGRQVLTGRDFAPPGPVGHAPSSARRVATVIDNDFGGVDNDFKNRRFVTQTPVTWDDD
jgi:hypothetical protein